jgi:Spy/CpxP family protein refolding chaperone
MTASSAYEQRPTQGNADTASSAVGGGQPRAQRLVTWVAMVALVSGAGARAADAVHAQSASRADGASLGNSVLSIELNRLRDQMRAFSGQMARMAPAAPAHSIAAMAPVTSGTALRAPDLTCRDCPRELGLMSSAIDSTSSAALPGFPNAPHLYHFGAGDFFLDHADHLGLSVTQRVTLGRLRESALMARDSSTRQIEEASQRLFQLTGADQPAVEQIESEVRRIEALRRTRRLAFIGAVGEAAQVLTDEQRRTLAGSVP